MRLELFFIFVLPNFVFANAAVVNRTGSCCRPRNVLLLLDGLLLFNMGLVDDVGDKSFGELLGLRESTLNDELIISIGRKHCASGLNVEVTSRSALLSSKDSCLCSE